MDALSPGMSAPDFTLPQASGSPPLPLSSLRGQPVVLAFSPPGWDPARAEALAQTNRLLAQAGFSGGLLSLSREGVWCEAAFPEGQMTFPLLTDADPTGEIAQQYGVSGKQALFVLDGEGIIRWRYVAAPGISPRIQDLLAGLHSLANPVQTTSAPDLPPAKSRGLTRREFLVASLGVAFALALSSAPARAEEPAAPPAVPLLTPSSRGTIPVTLQINGEAHTLQIEPRVTLLDALRERVGLTGTKKGCDHGQCGSCTVHVEGRRINSCLSLAVACQGKRIMTIEGLAQGDTLHPMQAAFIQHDGFQCGFCTPGQIMSATALLSEPVGPEDADVRENMSGNLCRCGAYPNIVAAVQDVRKGSGNASV